MHIHAIIGCMRVCTHTCAEQHITNAQACTPTRTHPDSNIPHMHRHKVHECTRTHTTHSTCSKTIVLQSPYVAVPPVNFWAFHSGLFFKFSYNMHAWEAALFPAVVCVYLNQPEVEEACPDSHSSQSTEARSWGRRSTRLGRPFWGNHVNDPQSSLALCG